MNRLNYSYLVSQMRGDYRLDQMPIEKLNTFRAYLVDASGKGENVINQRDTEALLAACDQSIEHRRGQ